MLGGEAPDLTPYLVDGEVTLIDNIALTTNDMTYLEGSASDLPVAQKLAFIKTFAGHRLNGNGYAINLSINVDCREFALFNQIGSITGSSDETVDAITKIHDLTLTGSITSAYTTTAKNQGLSLATIACYNNGAELYNVNSSVTITHQRSDFETANADKLKQGAIGGLVAMDQFGSPIYRNCHVTGTISTIGGVKHLGGLVAMLSNTSSDNYGVSTFTACEHTGDVSVQQPAGIHSDGYIGGIIGWSQTRQPILTDCINRGNFTIDLQSGVGSIQSCAGIIGSGYGTLTNCKNYGNITAIESALSASGGMINRRYGGLIGGSGSISASAQTEAKSYNQEVIDCANYGNIKASSSMMGGLIGQSEKNWKETAIIRNSVNEGNIESLSPAADMGGLVGRSCGINLYGCTNRGTLSGSCSRCASGLIGAIQTGGKTVTYEIDGCVSEGDLLFSGNVPINAGSTVQISGLVGVYYTTSIPLRITNCRVRCHIQGGNDAAVNLFYGGYKGGNVNQFGVDDYTQANSAILE